MEAPNMTARYCERQETKLHSLPSFVLENGYLLDLRESMHLRGWKKSILDRNHESLGSLHAKLY